MSASAPQEDENGPDSYERSQVVEIINSVIDKLGPGQGDAAATIVSEIQDLKNIIEAARAQLRATNPGDIPGKHIPTATDELDAVIEATEEASNTIMDACESIQGQMENIDETAAAVVEAEVARIFEACSFQDITGQRISKVVTALRQIEEKVTALLAIIGESGTSEDSGDSESEGDNLLNGPQLPGGGVTQDDIDKILAEFD